jgi:formylglycine-generating enzyme required for sulfatase activity
MVGARWRRAARFALFAPITLACGPGKLSVADEGTTGTASTSASSSTGTTMAMAEAEAPDDSAGASSSSEPATDDTTGPFIGCGNGILEPDEQCEGEDLAGATCLELFGYAGELGCTEACTLDPTGCMPPGMIFIPGGELEMGSDAFFDDERPARSVNVDPFYIDALEVTVVEYAECVQSGFCELPTPGEDCNWGIPGREDHPINCVMWQDAVDHCTWSGGALPKRLPTEAEWEKAARGADARQWPWGGDPLPSCTHVMMNEGMGGGCGAYSSQPVGQRPAGLSPYGVHDMAGSIWEWVADWYAVYDVAEHDNPTGPPTGTHRIIRGGGWDTVDVGWFRTSARNPHLPTMNNRNIGFRCAQDPPVLE